MKSLKKISLFLLHVILLTSTFSCSSMNTGSYLFAYFKQYDDASVLSGAGVQNGSMNNFTSSYFNTSNVSLSNMNGFLNGSNSILATFSMSEDNAHAVVITAYNSEKGKYVYFDSADGKYHMKSGNEFLTGLGISSCKTTNE